MRRTILGVVVLAAALVAVPAQAAPPTSVTFSVVEQFEPPAAGVFTSEGSVVCTSGTTSNLTLASGYQSDRAVNFHVRKTITCDDGSGTFTLQIQAREGFNVDDVVFGPRVVLGGTGAYVSLKGTGTVTGTPISGGVSDVYVGTLRIA